MDNKALIEELIRGQISATKLLETMQSTENPPDSPVGKLLKEIVGSFSNALSGLAALDRSPLKVEVATSCCSEGNSKKRKAQTPKTTSYRRRSHSPEYRKIQQTIEDGYTWRKYGQKEIYGTKYPRSYFRCTHKFDRDCQASRQVQPLEEDPSMFQITYFGEHTCMELHMTSAQSPGHKASSCIIDFAVKKATGDINRRASARPLETTPFTSSNVAASPPLPLTKPKPECDEEVLSNLTSGTSSPDLLSLDDLPKFEGSSPDQYDVSSSLDLYHLFDDMFQDNICQQVV